MNILTKTLLIYIYLLIVNTCVFNVSILYAKANWTFMVYLDGDNDLEKSAIKDFLELATIGSDANVNYVVQMDRISDYDSSYGDWTGCKRFYITYNMSPTPGNAIEDIGEVNMGNPDELIEFYNWGIRKYPAENYALILWDHGDGWSKKRRANKEKETIFKGICQDITNYDLLTTAELKNAIHSFHIKPTLIGFDACLMAMIENACALKDTGIEVMVGSEENEPANGWPYDTIAKGLSSNHLWSSKQLASWIVDKYYESMEKKETQSAIDLNKIDPLLQSLSHFSSTLKNSWDSNHDNLKNSAKEVMGRIDDCVINSKVGERYRGAGGLSVYFPLNSYKYRDSYKETDFAKRTNWHVFLSEYYRSMSGSIIEKNRNRSITFSFKHGTYGDNIDLYYFCKLFDENNDEGKIKYTIQEIDYNFIDIEYTGIKENVEDDEQIKINPLNFSFQFFGVTYQSFFISDNGVIYFVNTDDTSSNNELIPRCTLWGKKFIAPFWDDFDGAEIIWKVKNDGSKRFLIIQWNDVNKYFRPGNPNALSRDPATFQAVLYEDGTVKFHYKDTHMENEDIDKGKSATIGIQGSFLYGLLYSYNYPKINSQFSLLMTQKSVELCYYELSSNHKEFDSQGGESSIFITTGNNCSWSSSSNVSWINILEGKSGTGNDQIKYSVNKNYILSERVGEIKIEDKLFTIKQDPPCGYELSPSEKQFSASGGTGVVSVETSQSGCNWEVQISNTWINVSSGSVGTGNDKISYSVDYNPTLTERIGTISIGDNRFKIIQEKNIPETIQVYKNSVIKNIYLDLGVSQYYMLDMPIATKIFKISTEGGNGNCNLYLKYGQKPGIEDYDFASDKSDNNEDIIVLNPHAGKWYIMLYSNKTFSNVTLKIDYSNKLCTYTLIPSKINSVYTSNNESFKITTEDICQWQISHDNDWIEIDNNLSGSGEQEVMLKIQENLSISDRDGIIYVNEEELVVSQKGNPNIQIEMLENNIEKKSLLNSLKKSSYYKIEIPSEQKELTFELWGGEGDCDIYVKYNDVPTLGDFEYSSKKYGNNETITIEKPAEGVYYVMLYAYDKYSGVFLKATYSGLKCEYQLSASEILMDSQGGSDTIQIITNNSCQWNILNNNDWISIDSELSGNGSKTIQYAILPNDTLYERTCSLNIAGQLVFITQKSPISIKKLQTNISIDNLSASYHENLYFSIEVPEGQKQLIVDSWGGTGDFDMYIKHDALPYTDTYDNRCFAWGNDENIHIESPESGTWFIMLSAYEASFNASIKAQYHQLDCNYVVSPMTNHFSQLESDGVLSIQVEDNCSWTAIKHGKWLKILDETRRGHGNGIVRYNIFKNTNESMRTNNIRIANQWVTVIQQGTVFLEAAKMENDITITVEGVKNNANYYYIEVPDDLDSLQFNLSGGTGDCDLYIKHGEFPSFKRFDYKPYINGNNEQVIVEQPKSGKWYVLLHAYSDYSEASFNIKYTLPKCIFNISPTEISIDSKETTGNIQVNVESNCRWNPTSSVEWINVLPKESNSGNGSVEYVIYANYDLNERIGNILIDDITIRVIQEGSSFSSSPKDLEILKNSTWGLIYTIENTLSKTITFENNVGTDSSGDINLPCFDQSLNKGFAYYVKLPKDVGEGYGFSVLLKESKYYLFYFFKIYDDVLIGSVYTYKKESDEISDSYSLTGIKIDCSDSEDCTQNQLNTQFNEGKQFCIDHPNKCGISNGLYTENDMLNAVNNILKWDINNDKKINIIEILHTLKDISNE